MLQKHLYDLSVENIIERDPRQKRLERAQTRFHQTHCNLLLTGVVFGRERLGDHEFTQLVDHRELLVKVLLKHRNLL